MWSLRRQSGFWQGEERSDLEWKSIKRVSKKPTLIIIFSDTTHGFILPNRILGTEREKFYEFVALKVKK